MNILILLHHTFAVSDKHFLRIFLKSKFEQNWYEKMYLHLSDYSYKMKIEIDNDNAINSTLKTLYNPIFRRYNFRHIDFYFDLNNITGTNTWMINLENEFRASKSFLFNTIDIDKNLYEPNIFKSTILNNYFQKKLCLFGILMGIIIKKHRFLNMRFPKYFYKFLLGIPITESDVMIKGSRLIRNYEKIKQHSSTNKQLQKEYGVEKVGINSNGQLIFFKEIIRISHADNLFLNNCLLELRVAVIKGLTKTMLYIKNGLFQIIYPSIISNLNVENFYYLLHGKTNKINLHDWKINTKYTNCVDKSNITDIFWKYLKSLNPNQLKQMFTLLTGLHNVPLGGFANLIPQFEIIMGDGYRIYKYENKIILPLRKSDLLNTIKSSYIIQDGTVETEWVYFNVIT
ncbi:E3 ubiquitin-protein ligase HACE1 [Astathelohania contejeani]|uniref:HECT-type E3 ubiquitin transferase n=1 Tax=Astathelohania contejeani TaxID=164912 RepID=A0ABQ7HXL8_9MICR|nr:E3 ubiquitin-protein ligase HACE1 [Thelohania contejeani]